MTDIGKKLCHVLDAEPACENPFCVHLDVLVDILQPIGSARDDAPPPSQLILVARAHDERGRPDGPAATGRNGRTRPHQHVEETGLLSNGPPRVRRSPGRSRAWAPATARSRSRTTASSCRAPPADGASIYSLNRADGKGVWSKALGPAGSNDRGSGPRSTPTIDGDRVYVLTENGDLACLKAQDGTAVWQRNILKDFGGRNINWLLSESPLVDGNHVIVTPGGSSAGMVALDKMTGKTVWVARS